MAGHWSAIENQESAAETEPGTVGSSFRFGGSVSKRNGVMVNVESMTKHGAMQECLMDREGFARGIELFNRAEFFEAHEVLEDVWRVAPPAEKKFLQGIIQIAVALHHHSRGNLAGARSLMKRGAKNLCAYSEDFGGIRVDQLLRAVRHWERALGEQAKSPPPPQIQLLDK